MSQAERFEALLPRLMRVVLPSSEDDPLGHVPLGQIRLMRALEFGERPAGELSEELGLSPSALSQMAHRLEEAGYLRKLGDPDDRRQRMLDLTSEARCRMEERRRLRSERAAIALEVLTPAEREDLLRLLARVVGDATIGPISAAAEVQSGSPF